MRKLSLDAFTLKLIALISMGVHHTVMVLWKVFPIWVHLPMYVIRGVTFPIMAFFLVEGFRRTSNLKKYMIRLLIFAAIAQIPYMIALGLPTLNIIFSILIGLICLALYDKLYVNERRYVLFTAIFFAILLVSAMITEGGFFGIILIFLYHIIGDEKRRRTLPLVFWGAILVVSSVFTRVSYYLIPEMEEMEALVGVQGVTGLELMLAPYFVFPVAPFILIPLLRSYNGQLGRRAKYLFYAFYPVHFAILAIIALALGLTSFSLFSL